MAAVYILFSASLNKYYTGSCNDLSNRVHQHLSKYFPDAFTVKADDWEVHFYIEGLSYGQARKIELHIKK